MSASNMGTLTASLHSCSINHNATTAVVAARLERSSSSDDLAPADHLPNPLPLNSENDSSSSRSDCTLQLVELNSHLSLPYHWEQCLDLKTGEIYYVNWRNGMKMKLDPRLSSGESWGTGGGGGDRYSSSGEDEDSYESEGSSTGNSSWTSSSAGGGMRSTTAAVKVQMASSNNSKVQREEVLVVAGCRNCLMYFMLPKCLVDCPKCSGQLLHFDRSEQYVSL